MSFNTIRFLIFLCIPLRIFSQENDDKLVLFGEITDYFTEQSIDGVSIKVTENGKYVNRVVSDSKGEYEMYLEYDRNYTLIYEKATFVSKKIIINTEGIVPDDRAGINDLFLEITLFKADKDLHVAFLEKPIGRANYIPESNEIDWNMDYTTPILKRLNAVLDAFAQQKQERIEAEKVKKKQYRFM